MEPTFWLRIGADNVQTDSGRAYFVRPTLEVPTQGKLKTEIEPKPCTSPHLARVESCQIHHFFNFN